jgi:hypothetical protein
MLCTWSFWFWFWFLLFCCFPSFTPLIHHPFIITQPNPDNTIDTAFASPVRENTINRRKAGKAPKPDNSGLTLIMDHLGLDDDFTQQDLPKTRPRVSLTAIGHASMARYAAAALRVVWGFPWRVVVWFFGCMACVLGVHAWCCRFDPTLQTAGAAGWALVAACVVCVWRDTLRVFAHAYDAALDVAGAGPPLAHPHGVLAAAGAVRRRQR